MEVRDIMKSKISLFCKDKVQNSVALTVNGQLVKFDLDRDSEKPGPEHRRRTVYLNYNMSDNCLEENKLSFGLFRRGSEYTPSKEVEDYVFELLTNPTIQGINVGMEVENISLLFKFNPNLKIVDITQNFYKELFDLLYVEGKNLQNNEFGAETNSMLKMVFDTLALTNYYSLIDSRVLRYLKNSAKTNSDLKFYLNTFKCYIPIFIEADGLFNPFLRAKKYTRLIYNSELYNMSANRTLDIKGVSVRFISHARFCEALHFNGYTKLTTRFAYLILFGLLNPTFANANSYVYYNPQTGKNLSEEQFSQLTSAEDRSKYMKLSTLEVKCSKIYKTLNHSKYKDLYDIVKTASL